MRVINVSVGENMETV